MQLALVTDDTLGETREPARTPGRVPTRYEVEFVVGRGGMGEVVSARDQQIGRDVAIKRLRAKRPSDRATYRFLREAHVQGRLDHPAIVPVHEMGYDSEGVPYFVMKMLTGETLARILRDPDRSHTQQRLLRAFADICLAVEFAHTRGVVHRDLKPGNLVLGDFGEVYVIDWGIAKIVGEEDSEFEDVIGEEHVGTRVGSTLGTPGYMAPEQVRGDDIDGKADVYSLGCVLFFIVTGCPLHPSTKEAHRTTLELDEGRPSKLHADVPPELDDLVARATAGDRDKRPTARELADGVQRFLDGDRDLMLRRRLAEDHLAAAHAAFRTDDRVTAMREASAAIALDPRLGGAAEMLGRLMLEPPKQMPPEVEEALERDSGVTNRSQARIAMYPFLGYFGFTPFLYGYKGTHLWMLLYVAYILANLVLIRRRARGDSDSFLVRNPAAVAIRNAILVGVIAHVFSPLVLAPGLAAATTSALLISPLFQRPREMTILLASMVGAIAIPWLLEAAGVVTRTLTVTDHGAILYNPEIFGDALMRTIGWVFYGVGLVAAGIAIASHVKRTERESRGHLYLQAWQLRALLPNT